MDDAELDNLAAALREAFLRAIDYDGEIIVKWSEVSPFYQNLWKEVAREAHRWLVG